MLTYRLVLRSRFTFGPVQSQGEDDIRSDPRTVIVDNDNRSA